jgi:hypothetical protein
MSVKEFVISSELKSAEKVEKTVNTQKRILARSHTRYITSSSYNIDDSLSRPYIQSWYSKKMLQLKYIETLSNDWKDDEILPPNRKAFYWASEALEVLRKMDFPCDRIAASVDEGICIAFLSKKNKDKYADIEFFNNGEILAATTDRISKPRIWEVSIGNIRKALEEIREFIDASL